MCHCLLFCFALLHHHATSPASKGHYNDSYLCNLSSPTCLSYWRQSSNLVFHTAGVIKMGSNDIPHLFAWMCFHCKPTAISFLSLPLAISPPSLSFLLWLNIPAICFAKEYSAPYPGFLINFSDLLPRNNKSGRSDINNLSFPGFVCWEAAFFPSWQDRVHSGTHTINHCGQCQRSNEGCNWVPHFICEMTKLPHNVNESTEKMNWTGGRNEAWL